MGQRVALSNTGAKRAGFNRLGNGLLSMKRYEMHKPQIVERTDLPKNPKKGFV